ncbi:Hypothetical predicted protein [Lynx pardinus]|uniref:Ig-like domain-containing protein n=1 Tax=Lynx pardinus TaxID=191816 RepID=A0A485MM38_LYNPA|nr:Hypothetical predicted protein [Lynx pardinus]
MSLLEAVIFSSLWAFGLGQGKLEQPEISISRARGKSAHISCKMSTEVIDRAIHWYRQKPDQEIEHLTLISTQPVRVSLGGKSDKLEASKNAHTSTATLKINFLEQEDEAVYFCACWDWSHSWIKIFAEGTKLIVTPPDKSPDEDTSPKPTVFLPSPAERTLHKTGTYLCLLEDFFPDVIKVDWKEKNGKTILKSQQGNTVKTKDTYMKYTWLTVTEKSMDKEHKCIVKHEKNKGGVDQEILFPSINTELPAINSTEASLKDENASFRPPTAAACD